MLSPPAEGNSSRSITGCCDGCSPVDTSPAQADLRAALACSRPARPRLHRPRLENRSPKFKKTSKSRARRIARRRNLANATMVRLTLPGRTEVAVTTPLLPAVLEMLGVGEQATVTADPGVVCAGVVAVGAALPTPPVRTGPAAGRLAAGYLRVLRAAARRTTGDPRRGLLRHRRQAPAVHRSGVRAELALIRGACWRYRCGGGHTRPSNYSADDRGSRFATPVTSPASSTCATGKPTIGPTTRTACRPRARGRRTEQRDVVARLDALRRRQRRRHDAHPRDARHPELSALEDAVGTKCRHQLRAA